jgi:hypothetical protein
MKNDNMEFLKKVGDSATYIQDYNFNHLCDLPVEVAVEWVRKSCPETNMGIGVKGKDLTVENVIDSWMNKQFVIVDISHCVKLAVTNWDGHFSLYVEAYVKDCF